MSKRLVPILTILAVFCIAGPTPARQGSADESGWISLFDGKSLAGWKPSENKQTFSVRDGTIVANGPRSHLFYVGPVQNANFRNFEFKADVKTTPGSNSGIYFHTAYQEKGWPSKGYEIQINNTHKGPRKTGGIYAVKDILGKSPVEDGRWFTLHIIVRGSTITVKVNGRPTASWTEPPGFKAPKFPGRKISSGTFALQGHDPKSLVYFKNLMVKPLPPRSTGPLKVAVLTGGHGFQRKAFRDMFLSFKNLKFTEIQLKDHSEIFEDIANWDYDVLVMYNMTQEISPKRRENFKQLLDWGIGLVCLHHNLGAFQDWPEFKKICGAKYYLKPANQIGKQHRASTYKHDVDMQIRVADTSHPITRGLADFKIHDEAYKYCDFEKDNHVLLTTNHPDSDTTIAWTRKFARARICGIQLGHDASAYTNPNYRKLLSRAILWTAGRLN